MHGQQAPCFSCLMFLVIVIIDYDMRMIDVFEWTIVQDKMTMIQ